MEKQSQDLKEIIVSKEEFQESFLQLYHTIKNYSEILEGSHEKGKVNIKKLGQLISKSPNAIEFGGVNVQAMELMGAYMKFTLQLLKGDKLTFLMPKDPKDDFFSINDGFDEVSKNVQKVEQDLIEIEEKIFFLTRYLPITNREKIRLLLKAISGLFKSLVRRDGEDTSSHIHHIHHLTASRESYFLINDIGHMTREIYNSLEEFSNHLHLEDLEPAVDEMTDAVTKLGTVIRHMEDSANSTLDEVDLLMDKNEEEQQALSGLLGDLHQMEKQLLTYADAHPEAQTEISNIIQKFNDKAQKNAQERIKYLQSVQDTYMTITANQSFQDLTGQTLKKIIAFIEDLELQLLDILSKYAGNLPPDMQDHVTKVNDRIKSHDNGIKLEGPSSSASTSQNQVDKLLAGFGF